MARPSRRPAVSPHRYVAALASLVALTAAACIGAEPSSGTQPAATPGAAGSGTSGKSGSGQTGGVAGQAGQTASGAGGQPVAGAAGAAAGTGGASGSAPAGQAGAAGSSGTAGSSGAAQAGQGGAGAPQAGAAGQAGVSGQGGATGGGAQAGGGQAGASGGAGAQGGAGQGGKAGSSSSNPPVSIPSGAGSYTIDAHEVTVGEYADWYATGPTFIGQLSSCTWNIDFTPSVVPSGWPNVSTGRDLPITHVDWCDAFAYCKAQGRRLCGKIGGGALDWQSRTDTAQSQWHNACTSGGANAYVYGGASYVPQQCNSANADGSGKVVDVRSYPTCQSPTTGYGGVFDLSGNVWEWEDSCDVPSKPQDANCSIRGGAWDNNASESRCAETGIMYSRENANAFVGFRCCSG